PLPGAWSPRAASPRAPSLARAPALLPGRPHRARRAGPGCAAPSDRPGAGPARGRGGPAGAGRGGGTRSEAQGRAPAPDLDVDLVDADGEHAHAVDFVADAHEVIV